MSLFKTFKKVGFPRTAVVATLGIVTVGKWSAVPTFPSPFWGYVMQQVQEAVQLTSVLMDLYGLLFIDF